MKMEQIECPETSAYIIQTPGNYPKENIIYSEQGESLKSRILFFPEIYTIFSPMLLYYMHYFQLDSVTMAIFHTLFGIPFRAGRY